MWDINQLITPIKQLFNLAPFTTLVGIFLGAWLINAREERKDQRRYIERQLSEF